MLRDDMYERKPIFAIARPVTSLRLMSWVTLPMALFSLQNYVQVWNLRIACMISKHVNRGLSWQMLLSIWNHSPKVALLIIISRSSSKIGAGCSSIAWVADECNILPDQIKYSVESTTSTFRCRILKICASAGQKPTMMSWESRESQNKL